MTVFVILYIVILRRPHQHLLKKIEAHGICRNLLQWIKVVLLGRPQSVQVQGTVSEQHQVTSGIPQGTVLGSLLFVILINGMPDEIIHSYLYLFTDDTKLFKVIHNITDSELLQEDLERTQYCTDHAQLELYPEKCKHMRIRPTNILHAAFKYYLRKDLAPLQRTLQEKDIGS